MSETPKDSRENTAKDHDVAEEDSMRGSMRRRRQSSMVSFGGGSASPGSPKSAKSAASPSKSRSANLRGLRKAFYQSLTLKTEDSKKSEEDDEGAIPDSLDPMAANALLGGGEGLPPALGDGDDNGNDDKDDAEAKGSLLVPALRCPQLGSAAVALSYLLSQAKGGATKAGLLSPTAAKTPPVAKGGILTEPPIPMPPLSPPNNNKPQHQQQQGDSVTDRPSPVDPSVTGPAAAAMSGGNGVLTPSSKAIEYNTQSDLPLDAKLHITVEEIFDTLQLPLSYATNPQLSMAELVDVIRRFIRVDSRFAEAEINFCTLDVQRLESGVPNSPATADSQHRQFACSLSDFRSELQLDSASKNKVKIVCYDPEYVERALAIDDEDEDDGNGDALQMLASFVSPSIKQEKKQASSLSGPRTTTQTACVVDIHPGTQMVELANPALDSQAAQYGVEFREVPVHMLHRGMTAHGPQGRAQGFISIKMNSINNTTTGADLLSQEPSKSGSFHVEGVKTVVEEEPLTAVEQSMKESDPKHKPTPIFSSPPLLLPHIAPGVASHLVASAYGLFLMEHGKPNNHHGNTNENGGGEPTTAIQPEVLASMNGSLVLNPSLFDEQPSADDKINTASTAETASDLGGCLDLGKITRSLEMPAEHLYRSTMRVDQVAAYLRAYVKKEGLGTRVSLMPVLRKRKTKGAPCSVSLSHLEEMLQRISDVNLKGSFTHKQVEAPEGSGPEMAFLGLGPPPGAEEASSEQTATDKSSSVKPPEKPQAVLLFCHDANVAHSSLNIVSDGPHWSIFNGFSDISHAVLCYDTEPKKFGRSYFVPLEDLHNSMINGGFLLLTTPTVDAEALLPDISDQTVAAFVEDPKPYVPQLFLKTGLSSSSFPSKQKVPLALAAQALTNLGHPTTLSDILQGTLAADPTQLLATDLSLMDYTSSINAYLKGKNGLVAQSSAASSSSSRLASVTFLATLNTALEKKHQVIINFTRSMVLSAPPMPAEHALCDSAGDYALVVGYAHEESTLLVMDCNPDPSHRQWTVSALDLFKASQDVCMLSRRHRGMVFVGPATEMPQTKSIAGGSAEVDLAKMNETVYGSQINSLSLLHNVSPFAPTIFPIANALAMTANSLLVDSSSKAISPDQGLHRASSSGPSSCSALSAGRRLFDTDTIHTFANGFFSASFPNLDCKMEKSLVGVTKGALSKVSRRLLVVYDVKPVHKAAHSYTGLALVHPDSPALKDGGSAENGLLYCVDAEATSWGALWAATVADLATAVQGVLVIDAIPK